MRITDTEKDLQESVNDVLYEMLNNYQIKQKEKIYIEIDLKKKEEIERSGSIFLQSIMEFILESH